MKYTLWIVPEGSVKKKLQKVATSLCGKYGGPSFEVHMTLLGNVEMEKDEFVRRAGELAAGVVPFSAQLGEVSFSSTYFQNVFVRVRSSAPLIDLNWRAKKIYGMDNDVFMPHVSLLYGEQDASTRERAVKEVSLGEGLEFSVDTLVVTPATSDPDTWEHIAEIPLGS